MKISNLNRREVYGARSGRRSAPATRVAQESGRSPQESLTLSSPKSAPSSDGLAITLGTSGAAVGFALGVASSLVTGLGAVALVGIPALSALGGWAGLRVSDAIQGIERKPLTEQQQQERNRRMLEHAADLSDEMLFDPTSPIFMGD